MSNKITNLLLRHNFVDFPAVEDGEKANQEEITTVISNLSYYGYALNVEGYKHLCSITSKLLQVWWKDVEAELKSLTGEDRKIGDFVVYKNFPAEVLEKSEAEYWSAQILMYWGFPNDFFTQEVKPRDNMKEAGKAIVLRKSKCFTLKDILNNYLKSPAPWKESEFDDVKLLSGSLAVDFSLFNFKQNMIDLAAFFIQQNKIISVDTATDVLRLAAGLSNCDTSLREKVRFISFKKPVRKFLLGMLENCNNLSEDFARRPEMWKRLIHQLHPGDYAKKFHRVCKAIDDLYNDRLTTFNSKVEELLLKKDASVLDLLASRPGEFRRRLIHTASLFGDVAVKYFNERAIDKLSVSQIVSLRSFLNSVRMRQHRVFPPKGNWNKMQIGESRKLDQKQIDDLSLALGKALSAKVPGVKTLDVATSMIKLPSGGEVSPYTRGTVFPIPENVKFIRTASYWKQPVYSNTWFDNGWNFFNEKWESVGVCSWDRTHYRDSKVIGAIFSGDPTNSKEMQGRGAQLIDLYLDSLEELGARYAVWNILCYSRIPFSQAEDVFAALQWGEKPEEGKLFEPSRCQLSFPLKSKSYTKYICLIDLKKRELIYLDANLSAQTHSASSNGDILSKNMPAFMEYIDSLPSVYDLFCESIDSRSDVSILYSDKNIELNGGRAYVFKPENKNNKYRAIDINNILE